MKKLISMVVCTLMLWSCTIPVFAAESNIDNDNIHSPAFCTDVISEIADSTVMTVDAADQLDLENSFYLYNFNDEPVAVFYQLSPIGYAIAIQRITYRIFILTYCKKTSMIIILL